MIHLGDGRAADERCRAERPPLMPMGTSDAACWKATPTGGPVPDSLVRFVPRTAVIKESAS